MVVYVEKIGNPKGFGLSEKELGHLKSTEVDLCLNPTDYEEMGKNLPDNAPMVGIMLQHKSDYLYCPLDLVSALVKTGVWVCFIDPKNYRYQVKSKSLDALILPDADYALPEEYFSDADPQQTELSGETQTYLECLKKALERDLPILAIGKSALLLAGYDGLKLYRAAKGYIETPFDHSREAHDIELEKGTPFFELMHRQAVVSKVNSSHKEFVAPPKIQRELLELGEDDPLPFYAFARDGMPEAWGRMEDGVLGVLWNPALMAAEDKNQQRIFSWLVGQIRLKR